ncbi:hypothetical protein AAG570_000648 [Ranatra chinensis]|uniref:Coiled-coil domain-containing protein 39 n=1 Tax=Ranatra chinensis TaxID=642074 RepID=A0ABD0YXN2_9HEMI
MEGLRVQLEREKERANVLEGAYEKLVLDIQKSGAVDYMLQVQHSPNSKKRSVEKLLRSKKDIDKQLFDCESEGGILTKEIGNNKEDYNRKLMFMEDRCKEAVAKFNQLMEKNKQLEAKVIKLEDEAKDLRLEIEKKAGEISFLYNLSLITREKSHKDVEENMKRLSVNFELGVASKAENSNKFLNDKAELIQNYDKKIDELENKIRNELEGKYQLKEQ